VLERGGAGSRQRSACWNRGSRGGSDMGEKTGDEEVADKWIPATGDGEAADKWVPTKFGEVKVYF
jgi:hypothetical protein